jgi:hypothetical protein
MMIMLVIGAAWRQSAALLVRLVRLVGRVNLQFMSLGHAMSGLVALEINFFIFVTLIFLGRKSLHDGIEVETLSLALGFGLCLVLLLFANAWFALARFLASTAIAVVPSTFTRSLHDAIDPTSLAKLAILSRQFST